jgi:hypothetical protein
LLSQTGPNGSTGWEATFLSGEKRAVGRISFEQVAAFRVLDEVGVLQLWRASSTMPRPRRTTFKVRGHAWQEGSKLVWFHVSDGNCFSCLAATDDQVWEIVATSEPLVEVRPANVLRTPETGGLHSTRCGTSNPACTLTQQLFTCRAGR